MPKSATGRGWEELVADGLLLQGVPGIPTRTRRSEVCPLGPVGNLHMGSVQTEPGTQGTLSPGHLSALWEVFR